MTGSERPAGARADSSKGRGAPGRPRRPSPAQRPLHARVRGAARLGRPRARQAQVLLQAAVGVQRRGGPGRRRASPEAARCSCSRATGSVRFLIPWPARPVSPAPPAAAEGSHRQGEPPPPQLPPRARRPDVPAGRRACSTAGQSWPRASGAANPARPPRPALPVPALVLESADDAMAGVTVRA